MAVVFKLCMGLCVTGCFASALFLGMGRHCVCGTGVGLGLRIEPKERECRTVVPLHPFLHARGMESLGKDFAFCFACVCHLL
jgi:hypothetical protein